MKPAPASDRRRPPAPPIIRLRQHRPGDVGWVVHRHGALYAREYGWNERFEALVADIAARFLRRFDAARERCWIAELDGHPVGSVFVTRKSRTTAQLRLLLVEPSARGHGLGRRLVAVCVAFARARGYRKLVLWTQANLVAARRLYEEAGFVRKHRQAHREFGLPLISESWELPLVSRGRTNRTRGRRPGGSQQSAAAPRRRARHASKSAR